MCLTKTYITIDKKRVMCNTRVFSNSSSSRCCNFVIFTYNKVFKSEVFIKKEELLSISYTEDGSLLMSFIIDAVVFALSIFFSNRLSCVFPILSKIDLTSSCVSEDVTSFSFNIWIISSSVNIFVASVFLQKMMH